AWPKLTRINWRPMFSTIRTKVPSRGSTTPVFCDRMGLLVFNGSPGLMGNSFPPFVYDALFYFISRVCILVGSPPLYSSTFATPESNATKRPHPDGSRAGDFGVLRRGGDTTRKHS